VIREEGFENFLPFSRAVEFLAE